MSVCVRLRVCARVCLCVYGKAEPIIWKRNNLSGILLFHCPPHVSLSSSMNLNSFLVISYQGFYLSEVCLYMCESFCTANSN